MGTKWRYPIDDQIHLQDTLAETVSNAISRIESLSGKDSLCLVQEYREWLGSESGDDDVLALRKFQK